MGRFNHQGHGVIKTALDAIALSFAHYPRWEAGEEQVRKLRDATRDIDIPASAHTAWDAYCRWVRHMILKENPSDFLRWKNIRRTMCLTNHLYLRKALSSLTVLPDWETRWRPALRDPWVGNPVPFLFDSEFVGNSIHLACHIANWERWSERRVSDLASIVEFGAGYGSMFRIVRALGFTGHYVLYDLPQFSALQRFYLAGCGIEQGFSTIGGHENLKQAAGQLHGNRMFIANISLSETPIKTREPIRELVRDWEYFLITYQPRFHDLDNRAYFSTWDYNDRISKSMPLSYYADCYYLLSRLSA